jgi:CelD/BcsL family acetyltransferase involved in cellulose biosynthesis
MTVYSLDPLQDPRWKDFVKRHPRASVFHTPDWLEALRRTYGYQPVVLTASTPGHELRNGMVFCRIDSVLTGRRLVSLPFADHSEPLVDSSEEIEAILAYLDQEFRKGKWRSIEIRPRSLGWAAGTMFATSETFYFHTLDLHPKAEQLLHSFDKNSVQRKVRRAEREGLTHEEGRSDALLAKFYHLLVLTRRRHQVPPQPLDWFRNLIACMGEFLKIHVASKDGQPIASIITLRYRYTLVYKYGCSDPRLHNLGGVALLFWRAIQEAKQEGLQEFDFGRSDTDNPGLVTFKDHWGTTRSMLTYLRYPARISPTTGERHGMQLARRVLARAPDGILRLAGKLLYKHIG